MDTSWRSESQWGGEEDAESWRGELHRDDRWGGESYLGWPEELAGPEYWLFKEWRDRGTT
jgi:hypothetical protein